MSFRFGNGVYEINVLQWEGDINMKSFCFYLNDLLLSMRKFIKLTVFLSLCGNNLKARLFHLLNKIFGLKYVPLIFQKWEAGKFILMLESEESNDLFFKKAMFC